MSSMSTGTIRRLIKAGKIPAKSCLGRTYIELTVFNRFMDELPPPPLGKSKGRKLGSASIHLTIQPTMMS